LLLFFSFFLSFFLLFERSKPETDRYALSRQITYRNNKAPNPFVLAIKIASKIAIDSAMAANGLRAKWKKTESSIRPY